VSRSPAGASNLTQSARHDKQQRPDRKAPLYGQERRVLRAGDHQCGQYCDEQQNDEQQGAVAEGREPVDTPAVGARRALGETLRCTSASNCCWSISVTRDREVRNQPIERAGLESSTPAL